MGGLVLVVGISMPRLAMLSTVVSMNPVVPVYLRTDTTWGDVGGSQDYLQELHVADVHVE
jgi:hypothetical protein